MHIEKYLVLFFSFVVSYWCLANENCNTIRLISHQTLMKEKFDTSYWKRSWPGDLWHIQCIFVDVNGDGVEELITATTSEEDRMGDYWCFWKECNGKFKKMKLIGDIYFSCHADSFYKVKYQNGKSHIFGVGMNANVEKKLENGKRIAVRSTPNCTFDFLQNDSYRLTELKTSLNDMFDDDDVISIERLYPEWYFGFNFTLPEKSNPILRRMPYKVPCDDFYESPKDILHFDMFISEFKNQYRKRKSKAPKIVVFVVFIDVDNDGDMDCYISTNHDVLASGKLQWVLYTKNDRNYLLHDTSDKKYSVDLPGKVVAGTNAFCRAVYQKKASSYFVMTEESKLNLANRLVDIDIHRVEKLPVLSFEE